MKKYQKFNFIISKQFPLMKNCYIYNIYIIYIIYYVFSQHFIKLLLVLMIFIIEFDFIIEFI